MVKRKFSVSDTDKKDWLEFTKKKQLLFNKDNKLEKISIKNLKIQKLDLHGFSIDNANKIVKKFINTSYERGLKQLLVITGKGIRSKVKNNPYVSQEMNVLKNTVPEFIKNDKDLLKKIKKIETPPVKYGGEGAFYIFLKN
ncbi:MAG TPA: DNA mismatch repair protein MutS [Candidatus Pelagibacter sp.]|nr:DNA mismatch repair protein MutS [Candidatus Pelagibacter sp.]